MSETQVHSVTVYRRAIEPDLVAANVRLLSLEWALYFAADGTRTVAELGRHFRANPADRDRAVARLLGVGLIAENPLTAVEYVHALAATGEREDRTMREFLVGAMAAPAVPPAAPPRVPPAMPPDQLQTAARPPRRAPLAFRPLPAPERKEDRIMTPTRRLSLRALMNVIVRRAGSPEAGQLDIYRVFIKVDTLLLKRSGIETLRFTEDRLIADPELEQAIVRSVRKTLGIEPPEDVWVNVA